MKLVRLLALLAVLALLAYGRYLQSWRVQPIDRDGALSVGGTEFVRGATGDRFLRRGERLVDRAAGVQGSAADAAKLDDCPT